MDPVLFLRPRETARPTEKARYYLVDGLRGVAVILVTLHHFYNEGPASIRSGVAGVLPGALEWLLERGAAGVDIFFVISGFVIAHSVGTARVTPRYFRNFALRRSLRLDPPYWAAIALSLAVALASDRVLGGRSTRWPSWDCLLANMFYLQNFLQYEKLVFVSWTLTHEVQFYILFVCLFGLAQWASGRRGGYPSPPWLFAAFGLTGLASLFAPTDVLRFDARTCAQTWHLFAGGVFCYLFYRRAVPRWSALAYLAAASAILLGRGADPRSVVAVSTFGLLLLASVLGGLEGWLRSPLIQYFGRISYSLYLLHWPLGGRFLNLAARYHPDSRAWAIGAFLVACALSVLAAEALHRLVEAPAMRLARRLKTSADARRDEGPEHPGHAPGPAHVPTLG